MDTIEFLETPNPDMFTQMGKGDERLAVRFFKKAARDDVASDREGRMVFRELEWVHIMVPGDRDHIIIRPAGEGDKRRFSKQYADFRAGNSDQVIGTPLEMWNKLNLAQIEEFRYIGVRTVEQLSELNDIACQKYPGAYKLKEEAGKFIALLKEEAPLKKMMSELEKRDSEQAAMRAQMEAMAAELAQLRAGQQTTVELKQKKG